LTGEQDDGSHGGPGGDGGRGGRGGNGGAGAAGSSIGLVIADGSQPLLVDVTTEHAATVGLGGVAAAAHDGVPRSSVSQTVRLAARFADASALGLTVGQAARFQYDVSALQTPTNAAVTFALHSAFDPVVLIGNASANGRMGDCSVGDVGASGRCGLVCSVGGLRNGVVSRVAFDAGLPLNASISAIRAPLCACFELSVGSVVRESGYCVEIGNVLAPVVRQVDLSISANLGAAAAAGSTMRLQVTVRNEQPSIDAASPIVEVTIEDASLAPESVPSECEVVPATASTPPSQVNDLRVRCTLPTLLALTPTASVFVPFVVDPSARSLVASARVVPRAPDPVLGNNVWNETLALSRRFDLGVLVVDAPLPLGKKASVGALIRNKGPSTARNVTASVTFEKPVTIERAAISIANLTGTSCVTTDRSVTCQLPNVPPGDFLLDIPTTLTIDPGKMTVDVTGSVSTSDDGGSVGGGGDGEASTRDNMATLALPLTLPLPSVALVAPRIVPLVGEVNVTVQGDNFAQTPTLKCRVGAATPRAAVYKSPSEVTCPIPASPSNETGAFAVSVSNDGIVFSNATADIVYFVPPTLQLITPTPLAQRQSLEFVLNGVDFPDTPEIVVRFNGTIVGKCVRQDSAHLDCKLSGVQPAGVKRVALTIEGTDYDESSLLVDVVDTLPSTSVATTGATTVSKGS
jgi:hypothetical protein